MTDRPTSPLARALCATGLVEDGILVLLLLIMILLGAAQILLRDLLGTGLIWGDAFLRVLVLWVGLLGAVAATRDYNHITVDIVTRFLPARAKAASRVVIDLFTAFIASLIAVHAARLMLADRQAATNAFAFVPTWVCELILPVGFGIIALRYVLFFFAHVRAAVVGEKRP
jgi:TRAP-type C4-dicarboxylate transport system permease small subunit